MSDDILTITLNPALDLSTVTDRLEAGPKLRCRDPRFDPGGGGVNVSRVIAELGGTSTAWMALGGALGRMYQELLEGDGIRREVMETAGQTRMSVNVTEADSGDQYRFVLPGPEFDATSAAEVLDAIGAAVQGKGYAVLSGSMPPGLPDDFLAQLIARIGEAGAKLVVDSSGAPLQAALDAGVYLVKPNLKEAETLAGRRLGDMTARAEYAAELVEQGAARVVLLSLGAEGALVVGEGLRLRVMAPEVEVSSAVGAGDSTVAAMVLALARGESLEDAARLAVAAGAAAVSTPATVLCRREDVERLVDGVRVEPLEGDG